MGYERGNHREDTALWGHSPKETCQRATNPDMIDYSLCGLRSYHFGRRMFSCCAAFPGRGIGFWYWNCGSLRLDAKAKAGTKRVLAYPN